MNTIHNLKVITQKKFQSSEAEKIIFSLLPHFYVALFSAG